MKKKGFIFMLITTSLAGILLIGFLIVLINSPGKLPQLKDAQNNYIKGSISEKVWIEVNGIKQGMFIRGENINNPVILYLHGGPGTPLLQFIDYLDKDKQLEKYFTVCYWDQRGAGMTYNKSTDPKTMTLEQLIEDTREITEYLKSRFNQEKIFLVGQSWGTYLGVKTIEKYPENYLAYIGIGQVTNQTESERIAFDYIINRAKENNDNDVIKSLEKYNPHADNFSSMDYLIKIRPGLLNKYGIGLLHQGVSFPEILKALFVFRGYTLKEKANWFIGADFSMEYLYPLVIKDNLFKSSVNYEIPFYIIQGAYDYNTSQILAEDYLNTIESPKKEFFMFDKSAHSPNMEEPEKFVELIHKIAMENQL